MRISFQKNKQVIWVLLLFILQGQFCFSQSEKEYKTWYPAADSVNVLEGRAWPGEVKDFYDRLPAKAKNAVREAVWNLSKSSAGMQLRFQSDANEITIKYIVTGAKQMAHMPAIGVSGVDLYSRSINGKWLWAAGKFSFGDTVIYRYSALDGKDQGVANREYTLFLPLYNTVTWMEVTVPKQSYFKPLPVRNDKPIVVYGTSITQGACASRPGLAWTNILGRKLDRPVINLGFSGNGRLEKELIDLILEIDAKIYVLDCLPNLTAPGYVSTAELKRRIIASVLQIQTSRPLTPILFTEHDGYSDEEINPVRRKEYTDANNAFKQVFDSLVKAGVKNIYRLGKEEINQDIETMVDGVHPNDIGMMRYAEAYEKRIREIINEPVGTVSTTIPVSQRRDGNFYDWETRHNQILQYNKTSHPKLAFIGNSITHFWGGKPQASKASGSQSWEKYFAPMQPVNMGFGWDKIENVLWRVYHGELDEVSLQQIVLMIGTNNLKENSDEEIVQGIQFLLKAIQLKQPSAKILVLGILPRRNMEKRIIQLNKSIAIIPTGKNIKFAGAENILLNKDKKIDESLFSDGLHPNAGGYERLGSFIVNQLANHK
ncbi:MAG: SGNH/GDSL hydrolase family protein [Ferruginibacter sp.]